MEHNNKTNRILCYSAVVFFDSIKISTAPTQREPSSSVSQQRVFNMASNRGGVAANGMSGER